MTIVFLRCLNTIMCEKAFANAKTNVLNCDKQHVHILEIFLFKNTR